MEIINAAGMDETDGTYVDDAHLDIQDDDDDANHDTDDGGRGNLYTIKVPSC